MTDVLSHEDVLPHARVRAIAAFSWRLSRIPNLAALCGAQRVIFHPAHARAGEIDAVIVWGQKSTAAKGLAYAARHRLPCWRLEDGFLRSVRLGVDGAAPLSVVIDDDGIYYDARKPSRLERWLNHDGDDDPLADPALLARAKRAIDRIRATGISKYNATAPAEAELGASDGRRRVLVVDQTAGDLSVRCGLANADSFQRMLAAALRENPDAEIIVKTHPDVLAGKKSGYLEAATGDRIRLFAQDVPPFSLLNQVDHVYVVTSQLGFEALMAGREVSCFGAPWYAGWGVTDDRLAIPRRSTKRSVPALFAAAYLRYARYVDPNTQQAGEMEDVIEHLALQRSHFAPNRGRLFCFGFRFWKHGYMRSYLRCPGNEVIFAASAASAERHGLDEQTRFLIWGQRETPAVRSLADRHDIPIWRVEDGFLRSVGLGSDLAMPASLVFDRTGIYYDPRHACDLESLLGAATFSEQDLDRARALRERIIHAGLSKYNVGDDLQLSVPKNRHIVLVPGQVEDDASVQLGCRDIRTNLGLLQAARAARPDAFIIYKPHPDVLSGNRRGQVATEDALAACDHIETGATLARCLDAAREVHTMTSLVGFEALLREKQVVVYGQPFYAGWGLTEDRHPVARRTRSLNIDQLVAGTLIQYPRYLDRDARTFTTPEATIDKLLAERDEVGARSIEMTWLRRQLRKLAFVYKGLVHAP